MNAKPTFRGELMFPSNYVAAEDLGGRDVNVTISKVEIGTLRTTKGQERKFLVHFQGKKKSLVLNKTNAKLIAGIHGGKAEQWVGKRITLYPTTCDAFGQTTTCIRVRDRGPDQGADNAANGWDENDAPPPDEAPGEPLLTDDEAAEL